MTFTVNSATPEQDKVLLAFLDSLQYDYQTDFALLEEQQVEILRREREFKEGNITSRPWDEIKNDLEKLYH